MIKIAKKIILGFLSPAVINKLKYIKMSMILPYIKYKQKNKIENQKGKVINVVFIVIHHQVWKVDKLFERLLNDCKFNPVIVICPYTKVTDKITQSVMNDAYVFFEKKYGSSLVKSSKGENGWLDIKKHFDADLVFFTNPHPLTKKQYCIKHFSDVLTAYVPYSFPVTTTNEYNKPFHNRLWRFYLPTEYHGSVSKERAFDKGRNVVVTGYPGTEKLIYQDSQCSTPWKSPDGIKKVIWAPHHTIEDDFYLKMANFLKYAESFKTLAIELKGQVEFAFKPHPLLKQKLYKSPVWGEAATNEYYSFWEEQENTIYVTDDYIDLFITSDALIHDSVSFLAEYAFTVKPICYLMNASTKNSLNILGQRILSKAYQASELDDIRNFIYNVVINEDDIMKNERNSLYKEHLNTQNLRASELIYNDLCNSLFDESNKRFE
jgi:CDP-glycerol glycerophosphotransferase (TagB/SpsB family)